MLKLLCIGCLTIAFISCQKSGVSTGPDSTDTTINVNPVDSTPSVKVDYVSFIQEGNGGQYHITRNDKNQVVAIENLLGNTTYDANGRLVAFRVALYDASNDSIFYNSNGQAFILVSHTDNGFNVSDTIYYNSKNQVVHIQDWLGGYGDSLAFKYDNDSNLTRYERWVLLNEGKPRELTASMDYSDYDSNYNPVYHIMPNGITIAGIPLYNGTDHRDGDEYVQWSFHNPRIIAGYPVYYIYNSDGYPTDIGDNPQFFFKQDKIYY